MRFSPPSGVMTCGDDAFLTVIGMYGVRHRAVRLASGDFRAGSHCPMFHVKPCTFRRPMFHVKPCTLRRPMFHVKPCTLRRPMFHVKPTGPMFHVKPARRIGGEILGGCCESRSPRPWRGFRYRPVRRESQPPARLCGRLQEFPGYTTRIVGP